MAISHPSLITNPKFQTSNHSTQTVIVISGATAVGKTAVAIQAALHFNTVILSADSRQCYKELNIGVARPADEELKSVPHYFIASHSIHDQINAAFYESYAMRLLQKLFARRDVIIVAGGTGLYIKALLEGLDEIPEIPQPIRNAIINNYAANGIKWLQNELQNKDPLFAAQGEMQNPQRMMRALEVAVTTGQSIISFRNKEKTKRNFNIVQIGLELPRETLYHRINTRVDAMIAAGLETEVKTLLSNRHLNALQTVGYREMFDYFDGNISRDKAIDLIKQNTRRYAKRQMAWFKKQPDIHWFNKETEADIISFIMTKL